MLRVAMLAHPRDLPLIVELEEEVIGVAVELAVDQLAFAEVIGFAPAYALASLAIVGLTASYSAAVLKSWRRGGVIGGLLLALYAILYIPLSLEAYSLLIGSLMIFAALAAVMYFTRNIEWRRVGAVPPTAAPMEETSAEA